MSKDLLSSLVDQLVGLLGSFAAAAEDPWVLERFLQPLDASDPRLTSGLVEGLKGFAQSVDAFKAAQTALPSLQTIVAALEGIRNLVAGARSLSQGSASNYAHLGEDLLNLMALTWLRATSPLAYQIAATLGIAEFQTLPQIAIGDEIVRLSIPVERLAFDRIGTLFTNPLGLIREQLPSSPLATVTNAQQTADTIVNRIGGLLNALGVPWSYGYPPEHEKFLGDIATLAAYTMAIYLPTSIVGDDVAAGVCINLSSADTDDLGIVLTPFGSLTLQTTVGQWALSLGLAADVQAMAFGGGKGFKLLASAGSTEVHTLAKASTVGPPTDPNASTSGSTSATSGLGSAASEPPAAVIGSSNGSRLEFGSPRLTANLDATITSIDGGFSAGTGPSAVVIHPNDADSFLSSLLPSQGVRADFQFGVTWSRSKGLSWQGGAGLDVILPIGLTIGSTSGGLTVVSVELKLQVINATASLGVSATISASIGPVQATVAGIGVGATLSFPDSGGSLAVADLDLGFKPPTGVGLAIDVSGLTGGGFLSHDEAAAQYAGMLQLSYQQFQLQAFGLIATKLPTGPGYSLIAMIDANFPPIELVAGFTLNGVGGLFGIHRTFSKDALQAALKAHTLSNFLFTKNPVANAAQILTDLETFFPAANGRYVFGPLLQIGWGTPTLVTIDLALILELPDPVRLLLLGELAVLLPEPDAVLIELHMDVLGTIDFGTDEGSLDAVLHDSRLVGYPLHGAMALRGCWAGGDKTFLLAVGGFHPAFQPPPGFPTLDRLAISMPSGPISKLNLSGYLAVTSNTLQIGANLSMFVGVDGFGISGYLNFDALLERKPKLHFEADISGGITLSVDGHDVMSLDLSANMSGPAPWHVAGHVHFHVLWIGVTKSFSATFGDPATDQPVEQIDVGLELRTAFADPRNFTASLTTNENGLVSLRTPAASDVVLGHPSATLKIEQRIVPLGLAITRFGAAAPLGDTVFNISAVTVDGGAPQPTLPVLDNFAPAQFLSLSDDDELSSPSFEPFAAGASLAEGALTFGRATALAAAIAPETTFDTWVIDTKDGQPHQLGTSVAPNGPWTIFWGLADSGSRRYAAAAHPVVRAPLDYVVATTDQIAASGFGAATGQTYAQARAAMAAALAQNADRRGTLQIVARYEVP